MEKYYDVVLTTTGNVVTGASAAVTLVSTGLPATLYADNESSTITNPVTSDSRGVVAFKAANGEYDVTITNGADVTTRRVILHDPTEGISDWLEGRSGTYSSATAFVITGTPTDNFGNKLAHPGRRVAIYLGTSLAYRYADILTVTEAGNSTIALDPNTVTDANGAAATLANETLTVYFSAIGEKNTSSPRAYVTPAQFGGVPDGSTDASTALTRAIATGRHIDLDGKTWLISSKLTFNRARQYMRNGKLKFGGAYTTRLADITAADVKFDKVEIDGDNREVNTGLIYISDNAARFQMRGGSIGNILGTHQNGDTADGNNQYGFIISPYAVTNFLFEGVRFHDITNKNDGTNVAAGVGRGFTGGIVFNREDMGDPSDAQATPTSGLIYGCRFENIITVLANGLSEANQIDYADAEGVRFYGAVGGADTLYVTVDSCVFVDCSKRAVKGSNAKGVKLKNLTVVATSSLQYQMVCAVKLQGEGIELDGLTVYAPAATPIRLVFQTHSDNYVKVNNVTAYNCVQVWDIAPFETDDDITGLRVSNIRAYDVVDYGLRQSTQFNEAFDWKISDVSVRALAASVDCVGLDIGNLATNRADIQFRDVTLYNAECKVGFSGFDIDGVKVILNHATFSGSATNKSLVEIGNGFSAASRKSKLKNLNVEVLTCANTYLNGTRLNLVYVASDDTDVSDVTVSVPSNLSLSQSHFSIEGDRTNLTGLTYNGLGTVYLGQVTGGTNGPFVGLNASELRRHGSGASSNSFVFCGYMQSGVISDVIDTVDSSAQTVRTDNLTAEATRTYALLVQGVRSRTTNGSVVDGSSIAAVAVADAVAF